MTAKSQTPLLLIGESFSPWTKKARWALEQCELSYCYKEYTPTLSEPGLRLRLRQLTGEVSVPILFAGKKIVRGSFEIANYANESTTDGRLGDFDKNKAWNDLSEDALAEGRTRVVRCIMNNNQALEESLPAFVPKFLHRTMRFIARDAVKRLDRQYAHLVKPNAIRQALVQTREALAQSDSDFLQGDFIYADITMAVVLEVISPIALVEPPLGPVTERCWIDVDLAKEFEDLLLWRDRLAKNHATSYSQFVSR